MDRLNNPIMDGITHINIYTKGNTRLGRLLSNLSDIPLTHPKYGRFRTAEGFWYFLKTGRKYDDLRSMSGFEAKRYGSSLEKEWYADFRKEFMKGLDNKIESNAELKKLLMKSTLPFSHYYVYKSDNGKKIVEPSGSQWLIKYFTDKREELQMGI